MALMEILTVHVGIAVARCTLKLWLKDSPLARDVSVKIFDILAKKLPDFTARRRTEQQFDRMADEIASNLAPFFERESGDLPENEKEATAFAVAKTFSQAAIDEDILLAKNLDPLLLERYLRNTVKDATRDLSEAATALYDRVLREACNYVVEIVVSLPDFNLRTTREILKRENELIELVKKVLEQIPKAPATAYGEDKDDASFETQYRREVARKLDRLELFGIDFSAAPPRYALSVAYITLTSARTISETADLADEKKVGVGRGRSTLLTGLIEDERKIRSDALDQDEVEPLFIRVDEALAGCQRTFVRGEAGSGKTTLLQWLAVQSVRQGFDGALADWNETVPFFIQLRRYVDAELPGPEDFPHQVAKSIAGTMPNGWVHRQLTSGRALVLIDGVDELPETSRKQVREWLNDLTDNFPDTRYVITSRPPAVDEGWLDEQGFEEAELQPMTLSDIDAFIDHWHDAAQEASPNPDEVIDLDDFKKKLKRDIRDSRPIRNLANSPLLCAMLCALNRDRKTQIPKDRMELYRIALEMLLERRDIERAVLTEDMPQISWPEKELILQAFAYWLLLNNKSDADRPEAEECIARKLESMPHVRDGATRVFQFLLLRSGLLREPVEGRVDFIHRTFQEYLGAKEAINADDIGMLIEKAHLDQWREVIILAAGHARQNQRENLIKGLLKRGDAEWRYKHLMHLLAVACLETSAELSPEMTSELHQCLRSLIPPKNKTEAKSLASAGELAVPLLSGHSNKGVVIATACIRALALIGSEKALDILCEFGRDRRVTVVRELMRAWGSFDPEDFARQVLADSPLEQGRLEITDKTLLPGIRYLRNLVRLHCNFVQKLEDFTPLAGLKPLVGLNVSNCRRIIDLSQLASFKNLEYLNLRGCTGVTDLKPLAALEKLVRLYLIGCAGINDLAPLRGLGELTGLDLFGCAGVTDLAPLAKLTKLRNLNLGHCTGITDLAPLSRLRELRLLAFFGCTGVTDLAPLAMLEKLRFLYISKCTDVTDLAPIAGLKILKNLTLRGCTGITDLALLSGLGELNRLDLLGCTGITDLSPVRELGKLTSLDLDGCTGITDLSPLGRLKQLQTLDLDDCTGITDLSPLVGLEELKRIYLNGCTGITNLAPLIRLKKLQRVFVSDEKLGNALPQSFRQRISVMHYFRSTR